MLDSYLIGNSRRVSPEAPIPIVAVETETEKLGGAANVAANVRALGAGCYLFGVVGDDPGGATLINLLESKGVQHCVPRLPGYITTHKKRVISRNQQLLRIDHEQFCQVPEAVQSPLLKTFEHVLQKGSSVILSDYGKGMLRDPQVFIAIANAYGARVFVDPKGNSFEPYRGAYAVTPNLAEFERMSGVSSSQEQELVAGALSVCREYDIEHILITRSDKGMLLINSSGEVSNVVAQVREVFDVTGAGDTVIATLATAVSAGASLQDAVQLANLAAGIAVQKLGAATVSLDEIAAQMHTSFGHAMNVDELCSHLCSLRGQGKKIVMTNGCFDLLHPGHVRYLQQARALGDYLVIAVNDDESVKRLKGANRPLNTLSARMSVLQALQCVDFVISFEEDTPENLIGRLAPDVLVKGGDYTSDQVAGGKCVTDNGGSVVILPYLEGFSTTRMIEQIQSMH